MLHYLKVKFLAASMIFISLNSTAFAQAPVLEDISKNSFNVIRHLGRVDEPALSLASAEKVKRAVMADKSLDEGEKQMLQYLIDEQNFVIRVPTATVDAAYSKPVSVEAKLLFMKILNPHATLSGPKKVSPKINDKKSIETELLKSAEAGDANAQFRLAELYGDVGERDYYSVDKQIYWLKKASAQGHLDASYELAGEYAYGRHTDGSGIDRSYAKSFQLYKSTADRGHVKAMVEMGHKYNGGYGVDRSTAHATHWYKKAAERGNVLGMYFLAMQYLDVHVGPTQQERAIYWLKKASALGNEDAEGELWERWGID